MPRGCLTGVMSSDDTYEPSPIGWVRRQVELYESSGGTQGTMLGDSDLPVVVVTTRGVKTGKVRKVPLMRVEHEGRYAAVASMGGAPSNPVWYDNVRADPHIRLQDGPLVVDLVARELSGDERELWWDRAVAAFPPYAEYK